MDLKTVIKALELAVDLEENELISYEKYGLTTGADVLIAFKNGLKEAMLIQGRLRLLEESNTRKRDQVMQWKKQYANLLKKFHRLQKELIHTRGLS